MSTSGAGRVEGMQFFKTYAVGYNAGDLKYLLSLTGDYRPAGTVLAVTMNGISLMGGVCYSFRGKNGRDNDRDRSVTFMEDHMNFTHAEAEFLYSCVRCGIVHEGAPKVGVAFYLDPQNADATVIYKGTFPDRCIYLNVTAFARRYIEAVECIESGKITKACDFSMPPVDDRVDFDAAWGDLPDIGPLVMDAPQPYTSSSQSLRMPGEVLRIGLRVDPNP